MKLLEDDPHDMNAKLQMMTEIADKARLASGPLSSNLTWIALLRAHDISSSAHSFPMQSAQRIYYILGDSTSSLSCQINVQAAPKKKSWRFYSWFQSFPCTSIFWENSRTFWGTKIVYSRLFGTMKKSYAKYKVCTTVHVCCTNKTSLEDLLCYSTPLFYP